MSGFIGLSDAELKGGLLSRAERVLLYLAIIALLPVNAAWAAYVLALSAILSNITAIQRIIAALSKA